VYKKVKEKLEELKQGNTVNSMREELEEGDLLHERRIKEIS